MSHLKLVNKQLTFIRKCKQTAVIRIEDVNKQLKFLQNTYVNKQLTFLLKRKQTADIRFSNLWCEDSNETFLNDFSTMCMIVSHSKIALNKS